MPQQVSHQKGHQAPPAAPPADHHRGSGATPRSGTLADRVLAASGAAFVVAILVGNSLTETVATQDQTPRGTAEEVSAGVSSSAVTAGLALELLGLLCLLVFGAHLASSTVGRVRATTWPVLVSLAAGLLVAVKLASAAPVLAARAAVGDLPDDVVHALVETNGAAFVLTWIPMAMLVGAAAACLHEAGLVGRAWQVTGVVLAGLGLAAGVAGAVHPAAAVPVPFLLSLLWLAAVSVRLTVSLRGGSRPAPAR